MAISLPIPKHCWVIWLVLLGAAHANPLDESYVQDVTITTPSPGKTPPFGPDPWATAPSLQKTPNPIGRGLFNFYGCITCHNLPISPFANRRGPDLDRIGDKTHSVWLSRWLHDPETVLPNTRMPHIPLTTAERDTLVHFLMDQTGKTPLPISQTGNAIRGQELFEDAQCIRCHRPDQTEDTIGPALEGIREKIRTPWLVAYLIRPADLVPNTQMPDYEFSRTQAQDLTAFLLGAPSDHSRFSSPPGQRRDQRDAPNGLSLFVRKGCAGCHRVGTFYRPLSAPDPQGTAAFVNHHQTRRDHSPHISLGEAQRKAMASWITSNPAPETTDPLTFLQTFWQTPIPLQGFAPAAYDSTAAHLHPEKCGTCHTTQFTDWRTTVHSRGMGPGVMGQLIEEFGRDPGFVQGCQKCHAPLSEQHPMLDYHENGYETNYHFNPDLQHAGISCPVCHVRNHIRYGPPPTSKPAAKQWNGPGHGGAYTTSAFEDSDFCAKCHQFDPEGFALNGKLLQNTHTEWEQSPQAAEGETCQTCHMPDRRHLWRGIHHLPTVQEAVHIDVLPVSHTDSLIVQIRLYNTGAGHHLPTYITPKLFVQAQMLDKNAQIIKKATRVVGREIILTSQESREVFDTRIPAGGIWTWRYALAPTPTATHLAIDVEVHPDHFYLHFFQTYSRMGLSPEAVSLIDSAEARARHSTYSLVRHQWFIVDLFKN